ncbi:hypothetical protein B0186_02055 [Canicola haemoglobinophilus]|uniref:Fimbrial protein n=1 Tax=Canicola haemoglobinophilus TaxID=733 RepID=A0A1V4B2Z4_9PAST|nr:fimbrial protein [Canicola haemoglobinophilus]OOS01668.1 hypothetical protein B0186_02055 [Canicola haemoglobinophilus]STO59121.1 fimbrial protein [Canicola haemoglobinophilus]
MKKLTALALMGALSSLTHYSFAATATPHDGTINFNGKIVDQTCEVQSGDKNLTVTLPTVSKTNLKNKGNTAGETPFTIHLEKCKGVNEKQGNTVRLYFLPDSAKMDLANKVLKNTARNPAQNVGIQLTTSTLDDIPLGEAINKYIQSTDKVALSANVALNYKARYYATGVAGAGPVQASVQYNIVYD